MMKKLFAMVLALCLALGCTSALAAGKLEVTQETYTPINMYSFYGYVFAEVENTGDKNIEFGNGVFEILNADGDPMNSREVYSCYPGILAPGEKGYVVSYDSVDDAEKLEDVSDYTLTLTGKSTKDDPTTRVTSSAAFAETENSWGSKEYNVVATVTNDTDTTLYDLAVSYGIYDAEGKLLYAGAITTYNMGLPAGQTIELKDSVYADFVTLWETNGTQPASVNCVAFVNK